MPIAPLPIIGSYDVQRFTQFGPEDCANWTLTPAPTGKKKMAMYPVMGRRHINYLGTNRLIFDDEPRGIFKSINYWYAVVNNNIYRIDNQYNMVNITTSLPLETRSGNVFFTYLIAITITFVVFVDGQRIYVYVEPHDGTPATGFYVLSGIGVPENPTFVATFGNRIVVSNQDSSQFNLSQIFLGGNDFDPTEAFEVTTDTPLFAQEESIIRQFGVLNNTLYIFTDYNVGIWSDNPSNIVTSFSSDPVTFPWKKNTTYAWNYGIADPLSLDISFNMMVWLAKNKDGLVQVMATKGGLPERISTKAIDVLFQKFADAGITSPFLSRNASGFIYQCENTIFYRLSGGQYLDTGILDEAFLSSSIEYNFETSSWQRCIEANGQRSRIERHIFFNTKHFVTLKDDSTVYEMSCKFYDNEISNPESIDPHGEDAYLRLPFRYEKITPIISEDDYSEFITDYVEIDFVFGNKTFVYSEQPFANTVFLISETPGVDGQPVFIVSEEDDNTFVIQDGTNFPAFNETTYNKFFKPHIELYFSNDGGMTYFPADVREFSQLGVYQWRMRWYQLGASRNRVYKLICISPAPIVVLGGVMNIRRASGGAN